MHRFSPGSFHFYEHFIERFNVNGVDHFLRKISCQ
jgi:hypothetical protein